MRGRKLRIKCSASTGQKFEHKKGTSLLAPFFFARSHLPKQKPGTRRLAPGLFYALISNSIICAFLRDDLT